MTTDFLGLRQQRQQIDPDEYRPRHRAAKVGPFYDRIVCTCGSIAIADHKLQGWIDAAARAWMDSEEARAWDERGGSESEVPSEVHFYPFERDEEEEEDERKADMTWAMQRRAEKALQDEQSAYSRGFKHAKNLFDTRPKEVRAYKATEGTKERRRRYWARHKDRLNAERNAKRAAARAEAKAAED